MRNMRIVSAGVGLMVGLASCSNFLDSPKAVADPNNPTAANVNQLFVGVEANIFGEQEGPVAMLICEWMQQCAGVNGRFVDQQGVYSVSAGSFDGSFQSVYTAGGLGQIKKVEGLVANDKLYAGITEVLEAMNMLYAADIWGDVPYSEAVGTTSTPKFDPQMTVYSSLLTLLDKAISDMAAGGTGPGSYDLVYGGDKTKWTQAAHTLKARIHLHQVEKLGNGEYAQALAEANLGISAPANDWKTQHSPATSERNMWAQFQTSSFGNDLVAGSTLVDLMTAPAQNDPRLADYFGKNPSGGYGGYDVSTQTTPVADISPILGSGRTNDVTFSQPIITYDENQLIKAEATFVISGSAAAAPFLNSVRSEYGKPAILNPTLADIMDEKYIALFQNVETWNDYKRTCLPVMHPARSKAVIPGRLYYGQTEEQTNPNTPSSDTQNLFTVRNANDPNACPP